MIYKYLGICEKVLLLSNQINPSVPEVRMKSALVIGASRGIGRQIALTLSDHGYSVGVAARTVQHSVKTPGTVFSVVQEIEEAGGKALPIKVCGRIAGCKFLGPTVVVFVLRKLSIQG